MDFQLTITDVPSRTTKQVQDRLAAGTGAVVVGRPGSGKTHAVRRAVNGAAWVDLRDDEGQFDGFFTELAAQMPRGQGIIDALRARDTTAVLAEADAAIAGSPLVIDRGERLQFQETWGWDDPVEALWRPDQTRLAHWVEQRLGSRPMVVIARGRRDLFSGKERIQHTFSPHAWPLRLDDSKHGWRDWPALGHALQGLPAGFWVGALLLELMTREEFNDLVQSLGGSEESGEERGGLAPQEVLRELIGVLKARMPDDWRRALATVHALDGAPAEVIDGASRPADVATLRYLEELGAISRRASRLSLMPALLLNGPIAELLPRERPSILGAAARDLLKRVAHLANPDAKSAEWVVRAHAIQVELGDFEAACRTARFHLGGLVRLARNTSRSGKHSEARRIYSIIEPLTVGEPRVTSYVIHYQHMNARWSGEAPLDNVLEGLDRARALWPENALWWQRQTEILLEMGRGGDALRTVELAYGSVAEHPRRNLFLRVRPASHAMSLAGVQVDALRLVEPLDASVTTTDPETRIQIESIFARWRAGVVLPELGRSATGRLVFHESLAVMLERLGDTDFRAESRALGRMARADQALAALDKLAQTVADELRALIQIPSTRLKPEEVRRKGALLGRVDVLNSDIGLEHGDERWILGRFEGRTFIPVLTAVPVVEIDATIDVPVADPNTLYFGRFPVHRDGSPSGPPIAWELAGSGRSAEELWTLLHAMGTRPNE